MTTTKRKGGNSRVELVGIGSSDSFTVPAGCKIDSIVTKKNDTDAVNLSLGTAEGSVEAVSFDVLTSGITAVTEYGHVAVTAPCTTDKADFDIAFDSAMVPVVVPMLAGTNEVVYFTLNSGVSTSGDVLITLETAVADIAVAVTDASNTAALAAAQIRTNGAGLFTGWTINPVGATPELLEFTRTAVGPSIGAAGFQAQSTGLTTVDGVHNIIGVENQGRIAGVANAIVAAFAANPDYTVTADGAVISFESTVAEAKAGSGTLIATLGASGITFGAISFADIGAEDYHAGVTAVAPTDGTVLIATVGSPTTTATLSPAEVATVNTVAAGLRTDINADATSPWVATGTGANVILTAKGEGDLGAVSVTNGTAATITYSAPSVTNAGAGSSDVMGTVSLSTAGVAVQAVAKAMFSVTADQTVYINLSNTIADIDLYIEMSKFN